MFCRSAIVHLFTLRQAVCVCPEKLPLCRRADRLMGENEQPSSCTMGNCMLRCAKVQGSERCNRHVCKCKCRSTVAEKQLRGIRVIVTDAKRKDKAQFVPLYSGMMI